jgi:hypothetical protein
MKKITRLFLGSLCLYLAACETSTISPELNQAGREYFPLQKGLYWIYDVSRINYSFVDGNDTSYYQLKEVLTDAYLDAAGDSIYRLERFILPQGQEQWPYDPDSVWTVRASSQQAIRMENNVPFVKMVFPLRAISQWDQNLRNMQEPKISYLRDFRAPHTVNGKEFEQSIRIVEGGIMDGNKLLEADSSLYFYRKETEWYGEQVGLIEKERTVLRYVQPSNGIPVFPLSISSGSIKYSQRLKTHGKE